MRVTGTARAFVLAFVPLVGLATLQTGIPVLAPLLMAAAGERPETFGLVGGAMGAGSIWLYMANRAFTTALGPVVASRIAVLIAVGGLGLMATGRLAPMLLGAMLVGFGYAAMTPAGSQILADHVPAASRGTLFSLRQSGVPLGGVIAGAAGSWVAVQYGLLAALAGIATLAVAGALPLLAAPRAVNETRPRPPFRLAGLIAPEIIAAPFRTVAATPGLARIAAACIGFATVQGTVNAFFVLFATTELGLSLPFAGVLYATMQGASVAGRVALGFVADRLGSPRPVLRVLALLSALAALLLASLEASWGTPGLAAAMLFAGLSVATWNGLYLAEIAGLVPEAVGDATAGATFFVFATYMIVPPLMALVIARFGYRPIFVIAATAALAAALILTGPRRTRSPT